MSEQSPSKSNNITDFQRLDHNPGALVNTNNEALDSYKKAKSRFNQINKIEQLDDRLNNVESMLAQILEKLNAR